MHSPDPSRNATVKPAAASTVPTPGDAVPLAPSLLLSPVLGTPNPVLNPRRADSPELQIEALNAMRISPPELNTADIHTFFYALENWFEVWNISPKSDIKRYNLLKAQIPTRLLPELRHILENVPEKGKYAAAKKAIIQHFEESQRSRLHRLLSEMNLGDRKPSQLLSEMRRTANGAIADSMLLDMWIGRLPPYVQSAVIAAPHSAEEKVKVADAVTDSFALYSRMNPYPSVSEVRSDEIERLTRQIADLTQRFEQLLQTSSSRERSRARSRSRSRPSTRPDSRTSRGWCYYHQRFGARATNCRPPCSFNSQQPGDNSPHPSA